MGQLTSVTSDTNGQWLFIYFRDGTKDHPTVVNEPGTDEFSHGKLALEIKYMVAGGRSKIEFSREYTVVNKYEKDHEWIIL